MEISHDEESESDSEELREDENAAIKTYGFQDSVHNSQTSSGNLTPVDASDNECDNTYTRVNKSACKKSKVAKGKKIKNEAKNDLESIGKRRGNTKCKKEREKVGSRKSKRNVMENKLLDDEVEKGEVGEYGFEDSVRNRQTSSGILIIIDGSDKECDNTYTCKNTKEAKNDSENIGKRRGNTICKKERGKVGFRKSKRNVMKNKLLDDKVETGVEVNDDVNCLENLNHLQKPTHKKFKKVVKVKQEQKDKINIKKRIYPVKRDNNNNDDDENNDCISSDESAEELTEEIARTTMKKNIDSRIKRKVSSKKENIVPLDLSHDRPKRIRKTPDRFTY